MAKKQLDPDKFHCDMWYWECSARGRVDNGDVVRYNKKKEVLPSRAFCTSKGQYPVTKEVCNHCPELTRFLRKKPERRGKWQEMKLKDHNFLPIMENRDGTTT